MRKNSAQYQRDFIAAQKAKGLKRLVLWVQPEDVDAIRLAARQPHALTKLQRQVEQELRPEIEARIAGQLERRTRRAMLAQKGPTGLRL